MLPANFLQSHALVDSVVAQSFDATYNWTSSSLQEFEEELKSATEDTKDKIEGQADKVKQEADRK